MSCSKIQTRASTSGYKKSNNSVLPNKKNKSQEKLTFLSSLSINEELNLCHDEAIKYRVDYNKNKDELILVLFNLFNKKIFGNKLPDDMIFKWNHRLRTTAGVCFNKVDPLRTKDGFEQSFSQIQLSSKVIDNSERLRDTLLHELCHAACWIFDGVPKGHGKYWLKWTKKANKIFPELPLVKKCHNYTIKKKFMYICKQCNCRYGRHSKSVKNSKKCGYCVGEFELAANKLFFEFGKFIKGTKEWSYEPKQKPVYKKYCTLFGIYVKKYYFVTKIKNPSATHTEILQILIKYYNSHRETRINGPKHLICPYHKE